MGKKIFIFLFVAIFCIGAGFLAGEYFLGSSQTVQESSLKKQSAPLVAENKLLTETVPVDQASDEVKSNEKTAENLQDVKFVQMKVPFTVQAPFGNWSDPIFQNACEESSIAMVMGWVRGMAAISAQEAKEQILDIVNFENKTLGYNTDTDLTDVEKIFKIHFKHQNVSVKRSISLADIIQELQKGNIVIVPAFGQALANPNYTPPGPTAHMLVVTGYDPASKKFTTNDPGTRHGAEYRYDENVFFSAIWEYPSSAEAIGPPSEGKMKKSMLVVSKS